jgi:hypothetical protein
VKTLVLFFCTPPALANERDELCDQHPETNVAKFKQFILISDDDVDPRDLAAHRAAYEGSATAAAAKFKVEDPDWAADADPPVTPISKFNPDATSEYTLVVNAAQPGVLARTLLKFARAGVAVKVYEVTAEALQEL